MTSEKDTRSLYKEHGLNPRPPAAGPDRFNRAEWRELLLAMRGWTATVPTTPRRCAGGL